MADEFEKMVIQHRVTSMKLEQEMIANGRRGASQEAANAINQAGDEMAYTERELVRLYQEALNTREPEEDDIASLAARVLAAGPPIDPTP